MSNIKAGAVQAPLLSDSPKPSKTPHADIGDYEARVTRKAIWWTVVPVLGLTLALSVLLAMENRNPAPPSPSVSDLSVELATIHRAATAAGISQFRSADPGEVGAWLASQQVAVGRVPDLSSSGLTASGARLLSMPGGRWGMVHYKAEDRLASDLVLAIAPAGAAIVPPEAVAEEFAGQLVLLDRVKGVGLAYVTRLGNDWMLVSSVDETAMRGLVTNLLSTLH